MKTILFVCTANAGRSQIAEAFFNELAGGKARAISAGTSPAREVAPNVVAVMKEVGIDVEDQKPKLLTIDLLDKADLVITMGCEAKNACPASFTETIDWELEDPKGQPLDKIREIRNEIKARVEKLLSNA